MFPLPIDTRLVDLQTGKITQWWGLRVQEIINDLAADSGGGGTGSADIIHYDLTTGSTAIAAPVGTPSIFTVSARQDASGSRGVTWDPIYQLTTLLVPDPMPLSYMFVTFALRSSLYWPISFLNGLL